MITPLYSHKTVHSKDGKLKLRKRRFLIFTDELYRNRIRTFKILGIPIREVVEER